VARVLDLTPVRTYFEETNNQKTFVDSLVVTSLNRRALAQEKFRD